MYNMNAPRNSGSCILWGTSTGTLVAISTATSVDTRLMSRSSIDRHSIEYPRCLDQHYGDKERYVCRQVGGYVCTYMSAAIVDSAPILNRYFIITSMSISVDISVATRSIH